MTDKKQDEQQQDKKQDKKQKGKAQILEEGGAFGKRVSVPITPREQHISDIFPPGHLSIMIVGKSGCGKSFLVRELVPNIGNISQVIMLTKIINNPVSLALKQWCEHTPIHSRPIGKHDPNKHVSIPPTYPSSQSSNDPAPSASEQLTPDTPAASVSSSATTMSQAMQAILPQKEEAGPSNKGMIDYSEANDPESAKRLIEMKVSDKPPGTWGIVIADDFNSSTTSRTDPYMRVHNDIVTKLRNYGYHNISISQSLTSISTLARNNGNMFFFFNMDNPSAVIAARQSFTGSTHRDKSEFDKLFQYIKACPYSYMLIICDADRSRVLVNLPGDTKGLEEVGDDAHDTTVGQGKITKEELSDDPKLQSIIEKILFLESVTQSSMTRFKISRARSELSRHLEYLAHEAHMPLPDLEAMVKEIYQL